MPNKNYIKGRNKEYYIISKLRKEGYIAQRTAGSHSPIDIIAINPITKHIKLIQSKPRSMTESAKSLVLEANKALNGVFSVGFEVI